MLKFDGKNITNAIIIATKLYAPDIANRVKVVERSAVGRGAPTLRRYATIKYNPNAVPITITNFEKSTMVFAQNWVCFKKSFILK